MKAARAQLALRTLLNPHASQWQKIPEAAVLLRAAPLHLQPSRYIRTKWADRPVGVVRSVAVKVGYSSRYMFLRLQWSDPLPNVDYGRGMTFPDAAAVMFPTSGHAPPVAMGSPDEPVNIWYWRADSSRPQNLRAQGPGTVEPIDGPELWARANWQSGQWHLVFARALGDGGPGNVSLRPGSRVLAAFAIWEGNNQERGGLKAVSHTWTEIIL